MIKILVYYYVAGILLYTHFGFVIVVAIVGMVGVFSLLFVFVVKTVAVIGIFLQQLFNHLVELGHLWGWCICG